MDDYEPDTVLVAGVGRNLGQALVREFTARGATVGALARSGEYLRDLASEVTEATEGDGRVVPLPADVTDPDAVRAAVERLREAGGPVDCLVHNVYYTDTRPGGVREVEPDTLLGDYRTNVYGAAVCLRAVLPDMLDHPADPGASDGEGFGDHATDDPADDASDGDPERATPRKAGTLLVTGSPYAERATGDAVAWDTTTPALRGFTRSVARDLGPEGVQATYVSLDGTVAGVDDDPTLIDARQVAETYWRLAAQPPTGWSTEMDLRPSEDEFRT